MTTTPAKITDITNALAEPAAGTRMADMRLLRPREALTTDRHRFGQWKLLPYRCAEGAGYLACAPASANAQPVTLPLNLTGRHHVLLGLWSHGKIAFRAKLSDETCWRYISAPASQFSLTEVYLTTAELAGQNLSFAGWPADDGTAIGLAWVRLAPAPAESATVPATAAVQATSDVMTWVARKGTATPEELRSAIECLRDTNITGISFDCGMFGGRFQRARDLPDDHVHLMAYARHCQTFLRRLQEQGLDVLDLYHDFAKQAGLPQDYYLRLQEFRFKEPGTDTWRNPFYEQHQQCRCVFKDGRRTAQLSYAYPEVRAHLLAGLAKSLRPDITGLTLACNRSGPCVLYEEPVRSAYREQTGRDLCAEDETDEDVMRFRASFFTRFVRECRATLDNATARDGQPRHLRAIVLADRMSNLYYGFDIEDWVRQGLVNTLLVYPVYVDFSFSDKANTAAKPWEKDYHPDRLKRERRYIAARINRESASPAIEWAFFEKLRRDHKIKLYAGFTRIPPNAPAFLRELQNVYSHAVDGLLAWDMENFVTALDLRPLGENMGHREWLMSLSPETIPSYMREIPLHDLDDIPMDLFGAQMSG